MNTIMANAFNSASILPNQFPKWKGKRFSPIPQVPLIIKTNLRSITHQGYVSLQKTRMDVMKVKHLTGNGLAITEGGDVWKYQEEGNNVLVAVG